MCSAYWNLHARVFCPHCEVTDEEELQTHFMGEIGACVDVFEVGEEVDYLKGWSGVMDGTAHDDTFTFVCGTCQSYCSFGAKVKDGVVVELWHLNDHEKCNSN